MAERREADWQSERTLAECMRYMLDNEISTDVCFEVGPPGGDTVKFRAHKYMLISRSPVFEAMFSSGMVECRDHPEAKVRVEDVDGSIFKEILSYIYCEEVSVCPESAMYLMYAAKKYFLPKVVRECQKCIQESLDVNNVIHFLEQSLLFGHQELINDCLKLISVKPKTVLTGAEILSASRQVMEAILDADSTGVSELVIYETAIKWAKQKLQSAVPADNSTDLQIRDMLGDLLYKIRFPVMAPSEFAEISAGHSVLTAEEKESIYYFLSTRKKDGQLRFPTEQRISEEGWVDRTVRSSIEWRTSPNAYTDAINFKTDQEILLTGIGLYAAGNENGYRVDVEVFQMVNSLFKKSVTVQYSGDSNPFKVLLDEPIVIRAGVVYLVKALSHDHVRRYGQLSHMACNKGRVNFTFLCHPESLSTPKSCGQIPRLYFRYSIVR